MLNRFQSLEINESGGSYNDNYDWYIFKDRFHGKTNTVAFHFFHLFIFSFSLGMRSILIIVHKIKMENGEEHNIDN